MNIKGVGLAQWLDRFQITGPAKKMKKKSFQIANLGLEIDELCGTDHSKARL